MKTLTNYFTISNLYTSVIPNPKLLIKSQTESLLIRLPLIKIFLNICLQLMFTMILPIRRRISSKKIILLWACVSARLPPCCLSLTFFYSLLWLELSVKQLDEVIELFLFWIVGNAQFLIMKHINRYALTFSPFSKNYFFKSSPVMTLATINCFSLFL